MKRRLQLFVSAFILVLGLQTQSWAQGAGPISAETAQRIDAVFAAWDNTRSPGCALGVNQNGNLVYSRGYGMSNLEYDVPITPNSIFQVGSISKQFTSFSIALLATEGKLSLDDDVRRYLPEVPAYRQRITIRHLLTHTSGLRDALDLLDLAGGRPDDLITEDDVLSMIARQKSLDFVPGAEFNYNNSGFTLLAVIVKRVSGQSLREFAETRIFGPLGMHDTQFLDDPRMIVRRRASAYQPGPGGGWRIISIPLSSAVGPSGLYTTVGDLLKWQQNFVDARVGGRALLDEMQTPGRLNDGKTTDYGFGLAVDTYRGARTVGHGGSDAGYRAQVVQVYVVRDPNQHLAIAALCNLSTISPPDLTRKVADILLGSGALAPAVSVGEAEIAALAGMYWNPSIGVWRLAIKDGKLTMEVMEGNLFGISCALVPLGGGRFRAGEGPTEFLFPPPKTGAPQELHILPPASQLWHMRMVIARDTDVLSRVTVPSYSATDLKAYAGEYRSDELDARYTVVVMPEGGLVVLRKKVDPVPLTAVTLDTFSGGSLGGLSFVRARSGDVTGFTINYFGTPRRLPFTRVGVASSTGK